MRLACEALTVRYPTASVDALGDVTLQISAGEFCAVVGPSGSGKSTLLLALAALLRPSAGSVTLDSEDVWSGSVVAFRRRLGVVFQFPETQLFGATVEEEVAFCPRQQGLAADVVRTRVARAIQTCGLDAGMLARSPFSLSGGEQRRVAIAAALAGDPGILLFDEPTAGLDAAGRESLLALLRSLVEQGAGVLVVSHDAGEILARADTVAVLSAGSVAYTGDASRLRAQPERAEALGIRLGLEDTVAAALRGRGSSLRVSERWSPETLAAAIAGSRP